MKNIISITPRLTHYFCFRIWNEDISTFQSKRKCYSRWASSIKSKISIGHYTSSKPKKYCVKFWVLYNAVNSNVWNIHSYVVKDKGNEEKQHIHVVVDLTWLFDLYKDRWTYTSVKSWKVYTCYNMNLNVSSFEIKEHFIP